MKPVARAAARIAALATLLAAFLAAAFAAGGALAQSGEVNVYTYREAKLIQPMLDAFTKDTGVKVNVISASSGLEQRIKAEGANSPADVLLTVDIGRLEDAVRALGHLLEHPDLSGSFNAVSPHPCTNAEFTRALGQVLHRPTVFPVPAWVLRLVLGEMAQELLLASTRTLPVRLLASGFSFAHPELPETLRLLLGK